jgi:UPF0176 protein
MPYSIVTFYRFLPVQDVESLASKLQIEGRSRGLKGLIIFASEGINGTISGPSREAAEDYLAWVAKTLDTLPFETKWSEAPQAPFRKFNVKVREEIVSLGRPEVQGLPPKSPTHLPPEEWERVRCEDDVIMLDTRNWYETRIGKFENAIDPGIDEFHEFGPYLEKAGIPKDKKVLIYCTGGIRCEKAIVEMHDRGYQNVYQLEGGILNYLAKFPERGFQGECFVFDYRVSVDQHLNPSERYRLCPHCGQPADQKIECVRCDETAVICIKCVEHGPTCTKNCANHHRLNPGKKGRSQLLRRAPVAQTTLAQQKGAK